MDRPVIALHTIPRITSVPRATRAASTASLKFPCIQSDELFSQVAGDTIPQRQIATCGPHAYDVDQKHLELMRFLEMESRARYLHAP
jgi:hypothetical protein